MPDARRNSPARDVTSRVYLSRSLDADVRTKPLLLAGTECLTNAGVPVERQGETGMKRADARVSCGDDFVRRRRRAGLLLCNLRNLTTANCRRERFVQIQLRVFFFKAGHAIDGDSRRRQPGVIFLETGG